MYGTNSSHLAMLFPGVVFCVLTILKVIPLQEVAALSKAGPVLSGFFFFFFFFFYIPASTWCKYFFPAVILEPPENQYILEDEVATLICKVQGAKRAYWSINGTTTDHRQSYYEGLGVIFDNSNISESNSMTLTMIVPACLTSRVNNILCVAKDRNFHLQMSDAVGISVFKSFRKLTL